MNNKYVFGPVPSRRFGYSLGIDIIPPKICSLNCLYCECGKTLILTTIREEFVKYEDIVNEIKTFLENPPAIDVITITGSGEPTLNLNIGKVINYLKQNYNYKVVVLTNGTLLFNETVRGDINDADIVKISLDAATNGVFRKINNPCNGLNINKIVEGMIEFRKNFAGEIWLEIFIVPGINDSIEELSLIKEALIYIRPDKIHLNTLDRPSAFEKIEKASEENLERIKEFLLPLRSEIIARFDVDQTDKILLNEESVINILKRRPMTLEDLMKITNFNKPEVEQIINNLKDKGIIQEKLLERGFFYYIVG